LFGRDIEVKNDSDVVLLNYIKKEAHIKEGGCDLFNYEEDTYIISVASVTVGNKNELNCKKVGNAKAKKEIISYINGSEITSYTELVISESSSETLEGNRVEANQEYVETIKEKVFGVINQCTPLGGWYSEDGSVYYYAIFKLIE
jgi:hypothetical protein